MSRFAASTGPLDAPAIAGSVPRELARLSRHAYSGSSRRRVVGFVAVLACAFVASVPAAHAAHAAVHTAAPVKNTSKKTFTWTDYFGPTTVGTTCTRSSTSTVASSTATARQTVAISAQTPMATGTQVTEHVETSTDTASDGSTPTSSQPTSAQDLTYTLNRDGTLAVPNQSVSQSSLNINVDGFVVYPTIAALRAGRGYRNQITASVDMSALGLSGPQVLKLVLHYQVRPVSAADLIVTPAGTFADVLGVQVTITHVDSNLTGTDATALTSMLPLMRGAFASTVWFARKTGIVEADTSLGTVKLEGCTSPSGAPLTLFTGSAKASRVPAGLCAAFRQVKAAANAAPNSGTGSSSSSGSGLSSDWATEQSQALATRASARAAYRALDRHAPVALKPDTHLLARYVTATLAEYAKATGADEFAKAMLSTDLAALGFAANRIDAYGRKHCGTGLLMGQDTTTSKSSPTST